MSDSAADRLIGAEHRLQALRLRKEGYTYEAIGTRLGISRQRAHQLVTEELAKLRAETPEAAEEVRQPEQDWSSPLRRNPPRLLHLRTAS
jgi:orotate phosphoribosyltransferase-like protein